MDVLRRWIDLFVVAAIRSLLRHRVRNALAALGITIGTAAVVCVVAIGQAGSARAEQALASLGDNLVWVEAGGRAVNGIRTGTHGTNSLTPEDADAIAREVPEIKELSPNIDGHILVAHGNRNWTTRYRGVGPSFFDVRAWPLAFGSPLTDGEIENAQNVCILGATTRNEIFGEGTNPVGEQIRLGPLVCDVIGVLTPKGQTTTGWDQDDMVVLHWTTIVRKVKGKDSNYFDDVLCSAVSPEAVDKAADEITALLRQRHHIRPGEPDDFNIRRPDEVIKAEIAAKHTMAMFLVTVAAISLIVGGIGIMNVMLASVVERTREIGVRVAVGAKDWAVRVQFLGEAILLSLAGGVVGALLGVAGSLVLATALGWPLRVPALAIVLAPGFSAFVGILSGVYPAWRASSLDPIVALRAE